MKPIIVDDATFAHGTEQAAKLIPNKIPAQFNDPNNAWHQAAERAYRIGFGYKPSIKPKFGIDPMQALRHLGAIMASPIEDAEKIAAIAVLMHSWFDQVFWPELAHPEQIHNIQIAA